VLAGKAKPELPLFGDIPLLGYLFRFKSVRSKTNLLVFLTPRVIKEPRKITELTADRRRRWTLS
jgi:type II secretory pathway component GspD/PulD (secretin)